MTRRFFRLFFYIIFHSIGVAIHELSHLLFCYLTGIKVFEIKLFQLKRTAGYVKHQEPRYFIQSFFITLGPFILGNIVSFLLFIFAVSSFGNLTNQISIWDIAIIIVAIWLAISIAIHCFPSPGDANVLLYETNKRVLKDFNLFLLPFYPFIGVIKLINFLRRYYLDFIYALFLFGLAWYAILLT